MPLRRSDSERESSPHHRAQLIWTGIIAIILAVMALRQAADPSAGSMSSSTGDPVLGGNPAALLPGTRAPSSN